MPALRSSPVHLATSARTNASVSAGAMRRLRPLPISSRELTSAERVALSTSARNRSITARDVRAGANRPNHVSISRSSTPVSMIVGTCGMFGARARLDTTVRTSNGFEIAEADLELRGPGEFFGTRQSGELGFHIANPLRDKHLLELARKEALALVEEGTQRRELQRVLGMLPGEWQRRYHLAKVG